MASMSDVHVDMRVIDSNGQHVGTVKEVKMGDPEAVTAQGQTPQRPGGLVDVLRNAFAGNGDGLSDERAERLLRLGYMKVDATGLLAGDEYFASDDIELVADNVVHLRTPGEDRH